MFILSISLKYINKIVTSAMITSAMIANHGSFSCFISGIKLSYMSWNVWNRPSESFMVDIGISSKIMKSPSPKCYMTFWDMTIYNDTLNWSDITPICELITELDFITDFDFITKFGGFHRTLQRVRLANRGR